MIYFELWENDRQGFGKLIEEIQKYNKETDDPEKEEYYESALIAAEASSRFIRRYAETLRDYPNQCGLSIERRAEIEEMADICEKISCKPAESFREAV